MYFCCRNVILFHWERDIEEVYIHVPDVVILLCVMATVIVDHKVRTFLHITVKSLLFVVFQFSCISWIILQNELIIQRISVTIYIYI